MYTHGNCHLETNPLPFIHQRKRSTEAKRFASDLTQSFIEEPTLEFSFPISDKETEAYWG